MQGDGLPLNCAIGLNDAQPRRFPDRQNAEAVVVLADG